MRIPLPTSRGEFRLRFSGFDIGWAALSPLLALYVRDAQVLSYDGIGIAATYWLISLAFSLLAFSAFGLREGLTRYFSVPDAIDVTKAVLFAGLMTCAVLFTFTRLDGIPRSTPVIHILILGAGLMAGRAIARVAHSERKEVQRHHHLAVEHIIVIGVSELSSLYIRLLKALAPGRQQVTAALDEKPRSFGRSICGVRVIGPPSQLEVFIEEFAVHGIPTDRVVVGGWPEMLPSEVLQEVKRVCIRRSIALEFVPHHFRFGSQGDSYDPAQAEFLLDDAATGETFVVPDYFRYKRFIEFIVTLALLLVISPVFVIVAALVFIDVGSPIVFWQQRLGINASGFLLQKFRTLRPPFDWRGDEIPEEQRLSWIGKLLRKTHFDELPQLLNVLVGDMSLIGPRPLLPQDQPTTPAVRLMVRPGITGWAQINGGTLLSPQEKRDLDEWYIRNASLALDLYIALMTFVCLLRGDRRCDGALAQAEATNRGSHRPDGYGQATISPKTSPSLERDTLHPEARIS